MQLVFFLEAAQDRDGLRHAGLRHEDRLEAPGEGRILLDMLAVLVQRRGADAMELAAGERRLQHVGGIHRPLGLARAHQGVELVDEQDDLALGRGHFLQNGLEALLEFAAEFGAGDEGAQIQRQQALLAQPFRHVAVDDAERQALDDGGLADARLADQDGIVLGPARQDLDRAADLLVAADDRIELAFARRGRQVAGIFLERVVALLGILAGRLAALADFLDGAIQRLGRDPGRGQDLGRGRALGQGQRQQQAFGGDIAVTGLLGDLLGAVEEPRRLRRHIDLARATALDLGQLRELALHAGQRSLRIAPGSADEIGSEAFAVVQQDLQQMLRRKALVAAAKRQPLRRLNETPRTFGILLEIHYLPSLVCAPIGHAVDDASQQLPAIWVSG